LRLSDSRRLFGANLMSDGPAALVEVELDEGEDPAAAIAAWRREVEAVVPGARTAARRYAGGAALLVEGELDVLLALCDVAEHAVAPAPARRAELRQALEAARDDRLRAVLDAARARDVPVLVDDDVVSLGLGRRSRSYPRDALPQAVVWEGLGRIPVGLVTGTNGKTTSARLAGRMALEAGIAVGVATTDAVTVAGAVVASGDYTGPDAARLVLRHPEVDLAVLETARGGILRRGLAYDRPDAALITNVSDDHLGRYGVDDVATMARVKATVGRAVRREGTVVVNRDDPNLAGLSFDAAVVGFSTARPAEYGVEDGWLTARGQRLLPVAELPVAFGGAAPYNVANALGAAALAEALGVAREAVVAGLRGFEASDNPGRGNLVEVAGGVRVLLDFAHNPEGVRAFLALARGLGGRLHVVTAQPGDRRDEAIAAVAREIAGARPARVVVHDLAGYLRGRAPGEVPAILRRELEARGVPVEEAASEAAALARAMAGASPGDLVVLFPLLDPPGCRAALEARRGGA
jgi:UDP-N-acetylmuramyl tripeptide synthase